MRLSQAGVYVLIQKYGIEGLIVPDKVQSKDHSICTNIVFEAGSEEAHLNVIDSAGKETTVKVRQFDHLSVEINAEMIEFRRSINLHFRGCLNANSLSGEGIIKPVSQ